jgi:hypothetical protein
VTSTSTCSVPRVECTRSQCVLCAFTKWCLDTGTTLHLSIMCIVSVNRTFLEKLMISQLGTKKLDAFCVHKTWLLSRFFSVHASINCHIIPPSTPRSPEWSLPFKFPIADTHVTCCRCTRPQPSISQSEENNACMYTYVFQPTPYPVTTGELFSRGQADEASPSSSEVAMCGAISLLPHTSSWRGA